MSLTLSTEIQTALIAAVVSLIVAGLSWLQAFKLQQHAQRQWLDIKEIEAKMTRELASVESGLRERTELRIRMFELALRAVDETGPKIQRLIYTYKNYVYAQDVEEVVPRKLLAEVSDDVIATGMLLPPELSPAFEQLRSYVLGDMKARLHRAHATSEPGGASAIADEAFARADGLAAAFREKALAWKNAEWTALTQAAAK